MSYKEMANAETIVVIEELESGGELCVKRGYKMPPGTFRLPC